MTPSPISHFFLVIHNDLKWFYDIGFQTSMSMTLPKSGHPETVALLKIWRSPWSPKHVAQNAVRDFGENS